MLELFQIKVNNLILTTIGLLAAILLSGCVVNFSPPKPRSLTVIEIDQLNNPSIELVIQTEGYLDAAINFIAKAEERATEEGRSLSESEAVYASELGITEIESIRVFATKDFPLPSDEELREEFISFGFNSLFNRGITLGHAIFIKPKFEMEPRLIEHELVHVLQVERLGIREFLKQLMIAAKTLDNYNTMPFELEAYSRTEGDTY